jgi:hypothetical protein
VRHWNKNGKKISRFFVVFGFGS